MPLQDPSPHGNPRHSGGGEKAHPLSSASKLLPPHLFSILASCFLALASANAADVRISGLQTITNKEALGILKPRLVFINARPASPARANDAAFLLSQLLKNQGLPANKVSWTIPNSNTISLTVEEGPVRVIGNISIFNIDNQKLHDEILDYFLEPPIGTPLFSEAALPYLVESIDIAQKDATQHLQALGYWSAKITVENVPNPVDLSLVDLDVNIDLGPRYKLGKTVITGQLPTLDEKLQNELDRYIEKIANTENILALKELVTNSLYAAGYNFADVNLTQTLGSEENPGLLILAVDVQAGLTYRLGQLDITTAKDDKTNRTDINRLEDLFQKAKGQPYDRKLINKQRDKMLATGAFDAIRIVNKPNDDTGIIDIELELDESRARGVSGYGGIGSEEGLILGASFHDRNFLGKLWNFNIDTEFSNIGLLGQIRLSNPWFLGTDHPLNTRLWLLTREFEGYQKFEFGSEASVEFKVDDHYNLNLYANATWVDIDSLGLPSSALGDDNYAVQRIGLTQTFDLRNSKILPNDGFYIALDTELGNVLANDPILYAISPPAPALAGSTPAQTTLTYPLTSVTSLAALIPCALSPSVN